MKNLLLIIAIVFSFSITGVCQSSMINWSRNYGGLENDGSYCIQETNDGGYISCGYSLSADGDGYGHHGPTWYTDGLVIRLDADGDTLWVRSLGGTYNEYANYVIQCGDGGFLVACQSDSDDGDVTQTAGYEDFWIVKLNDNGLIEWEQSYGGSYIDYPLGIVQTADDNYVIAGTTSSTNGQISNPLGYDDIWVIKINQTGTLLWEKTIGGTDSDDALSIEQTYDGGFIIGGYSWSNDGDATFNNGYTDFWIVKTDSLANVQWQKSLGGTSYDYGLKAIQTSEGGYMIVGQSSSVNGDITSPKGGTDAWVVKLDSAGNITWQRSYGGTLTDRFNNVTQTFDGGYLFAGKSFSSDGDVGANYGVEDAWVVKTYANGDIEWEEHFGGDGIDIIYGLIQRSDGSFTFSGITTSSAIDIVNPHGAADFWVANLKCVPMSNPEICMVTVDTTTGKNMIVWDPTIHSGVASYYIYKEEFVANNYNIIGIVNAGSPSYFVDMNSDPAVQAWRYKLKALDTCGNFSELGGYHETIHLNVSPAGAGAGYNLIWDHYIAETGSQIAFGTGSYYIYRGISPNNMALHYIISSNATSWTDTDESQTYYYFIAAHKLDSCVVSTAKTMSGPFSQSFSNMDDNGVINGVNDITTKGGLSVFPNPYSEAVIINIKLADKSDVELIIYNSLGKKVVTLENGFLQKGDHFYRFTATEYGFSAGFYTLRYRCNDRVYTKQLVEMQ